MARMTFAAIAAVLLFACCAQQVAAERKLLTTCPTPKCPTNMKVVPTYQTACGYMCVKPCFTSCPPGPARDPLVCGGTTKKICPAIACTTASTSAVSGPGGCAAAQAAIQGIAVSETMFKTAVQTAAQPAIGQYCVKDLTVPIGVAASGASSAFAEAVANAYIDYYQFVCTCCPGNSEAISAVSADVEAVAKATAKAVQALTASVDCFGENLAYASAKADALAIDVQVAINTVFKKYTSTNGNVCTDFGGIKSEVETAVARATVCTFVAVYAAVVDTAEGYPEADAGSCSDSISVSGDFLGKYGEEQCLNDLKCARK